TKELVLGKDFVVVEDSYVGNVNRGTAKVTIKGIGEFGGNKTLNFKIVQRSITNVWGGFVDTFFE
ncbi:MAG: hypothetical protein IKW28_01985, partial [Lachnospiraceae bacterium]|nr:hypothetical protein [Lachnospiraceae bacterium]